jgi:Mg-chelatase subunit ChlD
MIALIAMALVAPSTDQTSAAGMPTVEYTDDAHGHYPTASWQTDDQPHVINAQGADARGTDGVTSWSGSPSDRTHAYRKFGNPDNPDFAIRKFARESSTPGLFDVYLNVRGNTATTATTQPLDLVFVIDTSGSMEENADGLQLVHNTSDYRDRWGSYWWRNALYDDVMERDANGQDVHLDAFMDDASHLIYRNHAAPDEFFQVTGSNHGQPYYDDIPNPGFTEDHGGGVLDTDTKAQALREGLAGFMDSISQLPAAERQLLRVGAVTFADADSPTNGQSVALGNPTTRQVEAMQNLVQPTFTGATFTEAGLIAGHDLLTEQGQPDAKQIMIVLSDGEPTYSYHVVRADTDGRQIYATQVDTSQVEGLGNTAAFEGRTHPSARPGTDDTHEYSVSGKLISTTWPATLGSARRIQQDTDVRALGIQLGRDTMAGMSASDVATKFARVASKVNGRRQMEQADTPAAITQYLREQAQLVSEELETDSVQAGSIKDPLGKQYQMASRTCAVRAYGDASVPDVRLTATGLTVSDINLGANQELQFHYQVRIRTSDADFRTNFWYPLNGATTFMPTNAADAQSASFGVPSGQAPPRELEVEKTWRIPVGAHLPATAQFTVHRRTLAGLDSDWTGYVNLTAADADTDTHWEREFFSATDSAGKYLAMPAYADDGRKLRYFVASENVPGYAATIDNDIDWATDEDDEADVTNTQYSLSVRKYAAGTTTALQGAKFALQKVTDFDAEQGTPLVLTAPITPGKYRLRETVAPDGYQLTEKIFEFEMTADGQWLDATGRPITEDDVPQSDHGYADGLYRQNATTLLVVVNDEEEPSVPILPHTGGPGRPWLPLFISTMIGILVVLLVYAVRKQRGWRE